MEIEPGGGAGGGEGAAGREGAQAGLERGAGGGTVNCGSGGNEAAGGNELGGRGGQGQAATFACKFCGKQFKWKHVQQRHESDIHSDTVKLFTCSQVINNTKLFRKYPAHNGCEKEFRTKQQAVNHIRSIHYKETFKCEVCDLEFNHPDQLQHHKKSKHTKKKICNLCKKCFAVFGGLG